jgi:hypothetical protein
MIVASLATYRPELVELALDPGEQRTIDLALASGGVALTGVVEDILGGPIANATVEARHVRAETDERGRFALAVAPDTQPTHVTASASGYGPRTQPANTDGKTPIVILLAQESTIVGRVVDEAGAPVAGANVRASQNGRRATSGADGTFAIDQLAPGDVELEASAPGKYGRAVGASVGIGERVENVVVTLIAARRVVATVEIKGDRDTCASTPVLEDRGFRVAPPWRDREGRFHFDAVPPGMYTVDLGCSARVAPLVVGGDDVEVTWRIAVGGTVKGRVSGVKKRADVFLARAGSTSQPIFETVDGEATFAFVDLAPGRYELYASVDTRGFTETKTFDLANGQVIEHDLVAPPSSLGRVAGKVVDEKGRPVEASLTFSTETVEGLTTVHATAGRYEEELPAGRYRVIPGARNMISGDVPTIEVRAGETVTHDVALRRRPGTEAERDKPERYELVGRVVDAAGAPVAGAIVSTMHWEPDGAGTLRVISRADGGFTLLSKHELAHVSAYRIGGGGGTGVVEVGKPATIAFARSTTIAGTVTRSDGSPAPRFAIRIGDHDGAATASFDHTGGRFTLPVATFPVKVTPMINGIAGERTTVEAATTELALRLPPAVTVRGRIVDGSSRKPIANVRVNGRQDREGWTPWFVIADQSTDDDGRFTVRDVPLGSLTLELVPPLDTWSTQSVTVDVSPEKTDLGELGMAQVRRR